MGTMRRHRREKLSVKEEPHLSSTLPRSRTLTCFSPTFCHSIAPPPSVKPQSLLFNGRENQQEGTWGDPRVSENKKDLDCQLGRIYTQNGNKSL